MKSATECGYSLTELMVVVMLVALLASIAVPSYQQYVLRTRRVDAQLLLMSVSHMQSRYFATHRHYARDMATLYGDNRQPQERYRAEIETPQDCLFSAGAGCYEVVVRAQPDSPQRRDSDCAVWRLDRFGQVEVRDSDNQVANTCR